MKRSVTNSPVSSNNKTNNNNDGRPFFRRKPNNSVTDTHQKTTRHHLKAKSSSLTLPDIENHNTSIKKNLGQNNNNPIHRVAKPSQQKLPNHFRPRSNNGNLNIHSPSLSSVGSNVMASSSIRRSPLRKYTSKLCVVLFTIVCFAYKLFHSNESNDVGGVHPSEFLSEEAYKGQRVKLPPSLSSSQLLILRNLNSSSGSQGTSDTLVLESSQAESAASTPIGKRKYAKKKTSFLPFNLSPEEQRLFLLEYGQRCSSVLGTGNTNNAPPNNILLDQFDFFRSSTKYGKISTQIWKYCTLYLYGGIYVDSDVTTLNSLSDILLSISDDKTTTDGTTKHFHYDPNIAILSSEYIQDDFLYLSRKHSPVAKQMLIELSTLTEETLRKDPLHMSQQLHSFISHGTGTSSEIWKFLELKCQPVQSVVSYDGLMSEIHVQENRCPIFKGHCCSITPPSNNDSVHDQTPMMLVRHPLPQLTDSLPTQIHGLPMPYIYQHPHHQTTDTQQQQEQASPNPYISTIREVVYSRPEYSLDPSSSHTPRMFDFLFENDCLPTNKNCHKCLRSYRSERGSCANCYQVCKCYCQVLCKVRPPQKFISKEYWVTPPKFRKDLDRIIPRIIHQTWFEPVTPEKYPNMSRLIESWKRSGWEYRFYDDDASAQFLSTHFPPEVREAFDAVLPGAFKADLFRYCVLLINGGVYADMDVLLEANLDSAIPQDMGFMTPIDGPGTEVGHRHCLWNGLLAVAPGHPILARVIELVVNNIRNRFTGVDYDDMLCPNPVLSVSHMVNFLFTAGPCILGAALNDVLGKHMQEEIKAGEIDIWEVEKKKNPSLVDMDTIINNNDVRRYIPGRTAILSQNKEDMGAHRFTLLEKNIILAATDMPDYEDRENQDSKHYTKTRVKAGIYGLDKLYKDNDIADEEIRIYIDGMEI